MVGLGHNFSFVCVSIGQGGTKRIIIFNGRGKKVF